MKHGYGEGHGIEPAVPQHLLESALGPIGKLGLMLDTDEAGEKCEHKRIEALATRL